MKSPISHTKKAPTLCICNDDTNAAEAWKVLEHEDVAYRSLFAPAQNVPPFLELHLLTIQLRRVKCRPPSAGRILTRHTYENKLCRSKILAALSRVVRQMRSRMACGFRFLKGNYETSQTATPILFTNTPNVAERVRLRVLRLWCESA